MSSSPKYYLGAAITATGLGNIWRNIRGMVPNMNFEDDENYNPSLRYVGDDYLVPYDPDPSWTVSIEDYGYIEKGDVGFTKITPDAVKECLEDGNELYREELEFIKTLCEDAEIVFACITYYD